ncbi:phosphatase PAP2 family protein [Desulfovermiculus halophilus]|jgi:undecaprenyl-diphosphatase|uniref:phosphatase PAP2 family protein n=1 Tax=Desulfovermiculus halophilus TaxID=339722 RepID=UPI000481D8C7|nr:phosphatase PAP2 family protein [Desulfovermiculus halophilus]
MTNFQLSLPQVRYPLLAAVGSAIVLALLTAGVTTQEIVKLDGCILQRINELQYPAADLLFRIMTWFGSFYLLGTAVLMAMIILICRHQGTVASFLGVTFYGASAMAVGLKMIIERQRPLIHEETISTLLAAYSFPSGHATQAAAFAFCLCWLVRHQKRTVQCLIAFLSGAVVFLVAFSRMYLQVHWPSDVLGGIMVSVFWVSAVLAVYSLLQSKKADA